MKYYKRELEEVYDELKSSPKGLSKHESKNKLEKYGENVLKTKDNINPIKIFFDQFKDFITYILIFAVIVSLLSGYFHSSDHYIDALIILIILIVNAIIGFFQEYSAQRSLEALKNLSRVQAKVLRGDDFVNIDSKYLVPGDIIYLEAGDKIPADARIIEQRKLKVEESALTGESLPVEKHSSIIKKDAQLPDQKNMLFSGTSISEGSAKAIVVATGMYTQIGKISDMISQVQDEMTPLQKRLDSFGKKLGLVIIAICLLVFIILNITNGFSTNNVLNFALVAISLAVAAVPTALPAVVTVALSIGVKKLLQKKALVRKLSSVETLGSCDVICTDKTGTLTKNEMTVKYAWTPDNETQIHGIGYNPHGEIDKKLDSLLYKIGYYCNNSSLYKQKGIWTISGDPTEAALLVSAKKSGIQKAYEKLDEIPFDSNRKLMSSLIQEKKDTIKMYTKGSTQQLLNKCTHILINGKKHKLTQKHKDQILSKNDEYSSKALRVLAFAYKPIKHKEEFKEEDLTFVGLQAMMDPPRKEVLDALQKTNSAGIRVIMITGDYKETAKAIGEQVGIKGEVLTGDEIDNMTEKELESALKNNTNIFARVIPKHKQRIVGALQNLGHTVAMTGDGVNDAPALKKANIGVAVGSGTDVAKEASDFVLLNDSFANIVNAIEEGRGIYDNIQKSIMLLLSGNFAEVMIIFLAVIFGFNLPLTALLLLWINMVTDGAPALAFGVDPYGKNIMKRKPIPSKQGILPSDKLWLIGTLGFVGTIIGLYIFNAYGGNTGDTAPMIAQTMIFNFIVILELILIFIIRKQYNIKQFTNWWLWFSMILTIFLQALIMYTPLSKVFGVVPLYAIDITILIISGLEFFAIYLIYHYLLKLKQTKIFANLIKS